MTKSEVISMLTARMLSGEPFTFMQMEAYRVTLVPANDPKGWRTVDALIQRLRKQGLIEFAKQGKVAIWTPIKAAA